MSSVMKVALQFTAIDMASAIADRVKNSIMRLGSASREVKKDFDDMSRHVSAGLKAIAVSAYALNKIKPGVAAAGDLQEAMIDVRLNLMESGKGAAALNKELASVRNTAVDVSKIAPFSAREVVAIENVFLKAGLKIQDVVGKRGAAYAATALATLSGELPDVIAEAMVMMATPFDIKGSAFGDLADFIQRVDAASATTIPELMEGMKYLSGTAAAMKLSWQDTLKMQGLVAQSGLRGSMGGTALNAFLQSLTGGGVRIMRLMPQVNAVLKSRGADPLEFFDRKGKMKTIPAIINNMRQAMQKLTDREQLILMERVFGEQGGRAALALIKEGEGSWESFGASVENAANLTDKINERLKGVNAQLKALAGTSQTTLASLFNPLLDPLARVISMLNDIVGKIGEVASASPKLSGIVSGGAVAAAAGAGAYGLYRLMKGGMAGSRVLKGMGGIKGLISSLGGTAAGIAEGKAVEAATGVTPVFVTNWPSSGFGVPGGVTSNAVKKLGWLGLAGAGLTGAAIGSAVVGGGTGLYSLYDAMHGGSGKNWIAEGMGYYATGKMGNEGYLGDMLYDLLHKQKPEVKNDIKLNINIDKDGRVVADTGQAGTDMTVNLNRGSLFAL